MEQKNYLKYAKEFDKVRVFSIAASILGIVMVILFTFAPIFKSTEKRKLSEAEMLRMLTMSQEELKKMYPSEEAFNDLWKNGLVTETKNFSIFNELTYSLNSIKNKSNDEYYYAGFAFIAFPLITIINGVIAIVVSGKKLYDLYTDKGDNYYMVKYSEIKKNVEEKLKKNFFKDQMEYSVAFDVLFTILFGKIYTIFFGNILDISKYTYFDNMSGVTVWAFFALLLIIGYMVVSSKKKKIEKQLVVEITREDFQTENSSM